MIDHKSPESKPAQMAPNCLHISHVVSTDLHPYSPGILKPQDSATRYGAEAAAHKDSTVKG